MQTGRVSHEAVTGRTPTGLILTGGGARAAYQVGVLSGIFDILDPDHRDDFPTPFPILCGSSAGAINAVSLASHAHSPHHGMERLCQLWSSLRTEMVYHSDAAGLLHTGLRWLAMLGLGWVAPSLRSGRPRSLLDNSPLRTLLQATIDFDRLAYNIAHGWQSALAITATAYNTGEHLTFYQSDITIKPWRRSLRRAVPAAIGVDHLMASSAIPFVFPAQALLIGGQTEWCGDGSMRQLAPMSPAIHLGAQRIVAIGTAHNDDTHPEKRHLSPGYPSLAQIGGQALSTIFIDSLSMDIERMERINDLLANVPADVLQSHSLKPLRTLVITPSSSLEDIAMTHLAQLPPAARTLFRVLGVSSKAQAGTGGALISYLLFESSYTQELIRLGRADSFSRIDEIKAFFKEASE